MTWKALQDNPSHPNVLPPQGLCTCFRSAGVFPDSHQARPSPPPALGSKAARVSGSPSPPPPCRLHLWSAMLPSAGTLVPQGLGAQTQQHLAPAGTLAPSRWSHVRRAQAPEGCAVCHTDPRSVQRDPGWAGRDLRETVLALGQGMVGFRSHRDWNLPKVTTSVQKTHANTTEDCLETGLLKASRKPFYLPTITFRLRKDKDPLAGHCQPSLGVSSRQTRGTCRGSWTRGPQPGLVPRLSREIWQQIPACVRRSLEFKGSARTLAPETGLLKESWPVVTCGPPGIPVTRPAPSPPTAPSPAPGRPPPSPAHVAPVGLHRAVVTVVLFFLTLELATKNVRSSRFLASL